MLLDAARLAAAGVLIGLPAAVLVMQMLRDAVYPTSPTDAGVYMIAITTVVAAVLAA